MKQYWNNDLPVWTNLLAWFVATVLVLGVLFGVMCLGGWLIMLLWNAILPTLFVGVSAITFWQAIGLNVLISLLSGGIGRAIVRLTSNN